MIFKKGDGTDEVDVVFRPFRESDAAVIGKCLYEAYGDTYVHPSFYSEKAVIEEYRSGNAAFSISETSDGETVGIVCGMYSPYFGKQLEMASQVILHKFRNYNISLGQLKYETERLGKEDCSSLYANVLAVHTRSQSAVERLGFVSCGFLLNVFDKSKFVAEYPVENPKTSQTLVALAVRKKDAGTLYADKELHGIIREVYGALGVNFELSERDEKPTSGGERVISEYDEKHKTLTIYVYSVGRRTVKKILEMCEEYKGERLFTANIFLNMCDGSAADAYRGLREAGFFFTGIHPLSEKGEFSVLHNLFGTRFELEDVRYIPSQTIFADEIIRQRSRV